MRSTVWYIFGRACSSLVEAGPDIMAQVLKKNGNFIHEPIYAEQLDAQAKKILKGYAVGRLLVPGDNRFLSGDLL